MKKKYYLSNNKLRFQIRDGVLISAGDIGNSVPVIYINKTEGFGNLVLRYKTSDELKEVWPLELEGFENSLPVHEKQTMVYRGSVKTDDFLCKVTYSLENDKLHHEIVVENCTDGKMELLDFGLLFAGQTNFAWGQDAGKEVLSHHFVAGGSSRSTYYRCDGKGKILVAFPEAGVNWVYYDNPDKKKKEVQDQGSTLIYSLNGECGRKVAEDGAKLRISPQSKVLETGEKYTYRMCYLIADDYQDCREKLIDNGQIVTESIPGYTVPRDLPVQLCVRSKAENLELLLEAAGENEKIQVLEKKGDAHYFKIDFHGLGERCLKVKCVWDGQEQITDLYYFVTEPIKTLLAKRSAFIAGKQIKDENLWYNGLLAEFNNDSGVVLSPDNYDLIKGWRIYEVTCDDPGLSKPSFLSTKLSVAPVQAEVDAMDYYIRNFVWGGLQQTPEEPYPYGIYGIPDWHVLRNSEDKGNGGQTHIWRIYDYPHIALMYYNMYVVAEHHPEVHTELTAEEYLDRAYGTAYGMFTIPDELSQWSAYQTGLYNELVIPDIIEALREHGKDFEADRLQRCWYRKAEYFCGEGRDVFGSEYAFDTTGFESTYYLAKDAQKFAALEREDAPWNHDATYENVMEFLNKQHACNIACRGVLEPAYFWYGSDYRGNNIHYLLSYMAQMGGCSLLDYACYDTDEPFELLRLAYGSMLSSWALLNTGDEESNYGYWFPGKDKDGCASGGFEALYHGHTWLGIPHHGGAWSYSCEIDLGFSGGVRGAATLVAEDPMFGTICYGGSLEEADGTYKVVSKDGVGRRFHYIGTNGKMHVVLKHQAFCEETPIEMSAAHDKFVIPVTGTGRGKLTLKSDAMGDYRVIEKTADAVTELGILKDGEELVLKLTAGSRTIVLEQL